MGMIFLRSCDEVMLLLVPIVMDLGGKSNPPKRTRHE